MLASCAIAGFSSNALSFRMNDRDWKLAVSAHSQAAANGVQGRPASRCDYKRLAGGLAGSHFRGALTQILERELECFAEVFARFLQRFAPESAHQAFHATNRQKHPSEAGSKTAVSNLSVKPALYGNGISNCLQMARAVVSLTSRCRGTLVIFLFVVCCQIE